MKKVEIYTKGYCPYCHRAKALLDHKGAAYEEIAIDGNSELRNEMIQRANGGWTVPQIFIDDQPVGGCDDLYMLERQNKLDALLGQ